jgi:putative transposase
VYVDLNMVRAGAVKHSSQWAHGGYCEIQKRPKRYGVIDLRELSRLLCGFAFTRLPFWRMEKFS